jgi:Zn-dependent protease
MDSRDNFLYLSVSCGNWFMTHVRVSLFVPLMVLCLCFNLGHFKVGVVFGGILFVTLLIHEFSHILAVRSTGGVGNEILIWPLGGLAFVQPAGTFRSQFLTPAAGPLSNLILCSLFFYPAWKSGHFPGLLNPLVFPGVRMEDTPAADLFILIFWCNWILFLVNLLPAFPLDASRMLLAVLKHRTDLESAAETAIRISVGAAMLTMLVGVALGNAWVVLLGAMIVILTLFEWIQMRTSEALDDSFMGYDFSQGYTSLERSAKPNPKAAKRRPSALQRWRERRRAEKDRRSKLEDEQAQRQLDTILEKVHQNGIGSLSDAERRTLNRASARLRDRGKQAE